MGAPGSGALNAGYAVTYGDLGETNRMNLVNLLDRQNEERQQRLEAQQQADAAHKFALQKYYGKEFDPNNFDTQTDLNQRLSDMATGSLKKVSDLINSGASDEDIDRAANQELSGIQKTYQIASAVKRNVDGSLEGLQNDKTLAPYIGSLKKQAFINALYTKDPKTGQLRLKNDQELSQIDPNQNFAGDILQHNPQLVVPGNVDWIGTKKLFGTPISQELSGEHYTSPGVKNSNDFKATWLDGLQKLTRDDKGVYKVVTLSDPIITKDANGNEIKIDALPESAINTMQATPGAKANMDVATQRWLAQHYPNNPQPAPGTEDFEKAKRIMGYEMTKDFGARAISNKSKENMSTLVIRDQLGYQRPGEGNGTDENKNADISASFKDITDAPFVGNNGVQGTIKDGTFVPAKMNKFFGTKYDGGEITGTVPLDKLPASVFHAVKSYIGNNDISGETVQDEKGKEVPTGFVKVKINNGEITAIRTDKGWFDVGDRTNANINTYNKTHGIKQKKDLIQPDEVKKKKDPLGLF